MDIESFPAHWEFEDSGKQIPKEGLLEVPPTSDEYWRGFEQLRAPTEPVNGRPGPGEPNAFRRSQCVFCSSLRSGYSERPGVCWTTVMGDAWISRLQRIQNTSLFSFFDFQRRRLESVATATGSSHQLQVTSSGTLTAQS